MGKRGHCNVHAVVLAFASTRITFLHSILASHGSTPKDHSLGVLSCQHTFNALYISRVRDHDLDLSNPDTRHTPASSLRCTSFSSCKQRLPISESHGQESPEVTKSPCSDYVA